MSIDKNLIKEVTGSANLIHNPKKKKQIEREKETGSKIMVYGVPKEWVEAIHANSMTVSKFAKNAMEEKLKALKLI